MCVRTKLLDVPLYSIAMGDLDSLTVVELKQRLKEKGLPVSGKKAELISRLEPEGDFIYLYDEDGNEEDDIPELKKPSGDKVEMDCPSCDTRIRVLSDYSGKVKCTVCDHSFDASEIENPWSHYWLGFFALALLLWIIFTESADGVFLLIGIIGQIPVLKAIQHYTRKKRNHDHAHLFWTAIIGVELFLIPTVFFAIYSYFNPCDGQLGCGIGEGFILLGFWIISAILVLFSIIFFFLYGHHKKPR